MRSATAFLAAAVFSFTALAFTAVAEEPLTRIAATSLNLPAEAPTFGFSTEPTLGNLSFSQPLAIATPPGETSRLFVVEKAGRIMVIPDLANPVASVFLDITGTVGTSGGEQGLLALAFHPDYGTNGYFYVWHTVSTATAAGNGRHDQLARYQVSEDPNVADPNSEMPLITQFDEASNHNGGDLHFGPDGYLYLSLGDEGNGNDFFGNGQRIDRDFFAAILRLDVDLRPGSLTPNSHPAVHAGTYAIPPDNPFIGATSFNGATVDPAKVRTEIWAIGLRNPFRFSFDPATGKLWVGDVGQNAREEIAIVEGGQNHGWPYREGFIAGPRSNSPAGSEFTNPVFDYAPPGSQSVTGGIVYRGSALSQLFGKYVFADYVTGQIYALSADNPGPATAETLTTDSGIAGFGTNPRTGDLIFSDLGEGRIKRIVHNSTQTGASFPETLSGTGAFADLETLEAASGLIAYEPNVSFWSDHAEKARWFALHDETSTFTFAPQDNWTLPSGAVWMKHFNLELTRGDPATARRIETRFLVRTDDGVYGITYRWNSEQTEAFLVPDEGADEDFAVMENGQLRTQIWRYPSRAECLACHTPQGGHALSFNTRQLNRIHAFPGGEANHLEAMEKAGYFSNSVPPSAALLRLASPDEETASINIRARSYLDANCANCHQPGGTAPSTWDARFSTPLSIAGIIDGALANEGALPDSGADTAFRLLVPGDPDHSRILHRVAGTHDTTRMPPLGTNERDLAAEALLTEWINHLATTTPEPQLINLSGRAHAGIGNNILTPSFVIEGEGVKSVLIRAVGPGLAEFEVESPLTDPVLDLFFGPDKIDTNVGWGTTPNADAIQTAAASVGAFPLPEASADSALLVNLAPGPYTAQVSGAEGATGTALVEVYDASPAQSADRIRLVNTALRARVGGPAGVLIPGLVVNEGPPVSVLLRAIGPGLAGFGVTDFLPAPRLTLLFNGSPVAENDGWNMAADAARIRDAAEAVGAFPLDQMGDDAALLVTLPPGAYTLHIDSSESGEGVALMEVYELQ